MLKLYTMGGVFMHPILLLWILGTAIGLSKLYILYRLRRRGSNLLNRVNGLAGNGNIDEALRHCRATPGPVANILQAGLSRAGKGSTGAEQAIAGTGQLEMAFLENGLPWLGYIIVVAPLLGFTGTVWGMIEAFEAIKLVDDINPAVVAGGISQALMTTVFGLIVAMTIQFFHNSSSILIDKLMIEMEEAALLITDTLFYRPLTGIPQGEGEDK